MKEALRCERSVLNSSKLLPDLSNWGETAFVCLAVTHF